MHEQVLHFNAADNPTLRVSAVTRGNDTHYDFQGVIDAHAKPVLEELEKTPPETPNAVLNFAEVGRINSMGLALLLKVLNTWEKSGVRIRAINLNRMVTILFKITGLGRFLEGGNESPEASPGKKTSTSETKVTQPAPQREKLQFFAYLQTTQQLNGWFLFNTYLQRQLQRAIQFQAKTLAERTTRKEEGEPADILFVDPFEACRLIRQRDFQVLAKPVGETTEVVLLAHAEDKRALDQVSRPKVAVAGKDNFVYLLGRFLCDERGIDSAQFQFFEVGNDIKAAQFLIRQRVDWVMMSSKTFEGLSSLSRRQLKVLDQSQTELAACFFCAAPYLSEDLRRHLQAMLTSMRDDSKGQQILRDLELEGWEVPEPAETELLLKVYDAYAA